MREIEQFGLNHSSDMDFKDFMNLYNKFAEKHIFFYSC